MKSFGIGCGSWLGEESWTHPEQDLDNFSSTLQQNQLQGKKSQETEGMFGTLSNPIDYFHTHILQ